MVIFAQCSAQLPDGHIGWLDALLRFRAD